MKQYDRLKIEKPPKTIAELSTFADFLQPRLSTGSVRLCDSDHYGVHIKCQFKEGQCDILDEGKYFDLALYSTAESEAANKEAFGQVVELFKEWLAL